MNAFSAYMKSNNLNSALLHKLTSFNSQSANISKAIEQFYDAIDVEASKTNGNSC
jgi:hypothetical protein